MAFNLEDYTTVQERSNIFWERYPNGAVRTRIVSESDTRVIVVCELFRDNADEKPFATGEAKEVISDRGVNRDFALENCATSARGVAFKVANIGTEKNGPSREEMARVNEKQAFKPKYGAPGSKSAAMEYALHIVETQSKASANEPVPVTWSVGETISEVGQVPDVSFTCRHGDMVKKTGTAKTGRPFAGFVCTAPKDDQCDAKWAKLTSGGTWFWPDDVEPGKGGE